MDIEHLPFAVVELDADRVVVAANPGAGQLLDVDSTSLIGQTIGQAMRPRRLSGEDLLATDWHKSAYFSGAKRIVEQEALVRRADGSEVEVLVEGSYNRDPNGGLRGAVIVLRPRHRGARRPRSGVRIVSAVSHELRSPLTSIRGYTSLLLKRWDSVADEDRKLMLGQIDHDARRISRLIGELLDISRIESGRVQLNRQEIDIPILAAQTVVKVKMSYPELSADVRFASDFPNVWADPDKVEQVLTNLIENACKYASPTGISITGRFEDDRIEVFVTDQGPGIPPADAARLFQQFFKSREGRPSGTGLGLWISRGLAEAHNGTLTVTSDGEHGATFIFSLPRRAFERVHPTLA